MRKALLQTLTARESEKAVPQSSSSTPRLHDHRPANRDPLRLKGRGSGSAESMSAVSSTESKRGSETSALRTLTEARDGTGNDDRRARAARKGKQRTTRDVFPRDPMVACREICYTAATAQHSSVQAKRCPEAERTALSEEWDELLLDSLERQRDA